MNTATAKSIVPSSFQQNIYNFLTDGTGSAVIVAVAGSGKTTTIVEAAKLLPAQAASTFVAFNKAIALELGARLPSNVRAQTLNAMGFGAWSRACTGKRLFVDAQKVRKIIDELIPEQEAKLYNGNLARLVGLAKSAGLVPQGAQGKGLTEDTNFAWQEIIDFHDIQLAEEADMDSFIDAARNVLRESIRVADRVIDFDDQLYMPVIRRVNFFKNDFLFVDEAQDVNMIQRAMLRMALKPNGRLIAVGDPYQAIYGFRGAEHDAIELIKAQFSAIELPLSISYRCPKAVVREAQKYAPHILAADTAPEGVVAEAKQFKVTDFQPHDVVVCRCTAPVVALAYKLIRQKVACFVMGREIGQGLLSLIGKMKAKDVDQLYDKLDAYRDRETRRLLERKQDSKAEALNDRLDTIAVFMDSLDENDRSILALTNAISALFSDNMQASAVKLMTQHKSKGLEADNVYILDFKLNRKFMAKVSNQQKQEYNLAYVAITRAKKQLTYIDSDMFKKAGK